MKAQDLFNSFQSLGTQIVQDRKSANVIKVQEKTEKLHEQVARILWINNILPSSKIVEAIQTLEKQQHNKDTEQKQATAKLKEHFFSYARELKTKAHEFFQRNGKLDPEEFFAQVTFQNALKLEVWEKYVNQFNEHTRFLENVVEQLDIMHTTTTNMVDDNEEKITISSCWTSKSPGAELFQEAFTIVTNSMKSNIPLVRTQQQNEEVAQKIQIQEVVIWNSILKRTEQFCKDVSYVPEAVTGKKENEYSLAIHLKNNEFDLSPILTMEKETALLELNKVQEVKAVDNKPLAQAYSNWLHRNQKHVWGKLELELEEEIQISLSHMLELRKEDITSASKLTIQKLPNQVERLKTKQCSSLELYNVFVQELEQATNQAVIADHIEWINSTYKEIHAVVKSSKPGLIFGDPWREKATQILEKRKKTPLTGNYDMMIEHKIKTINTEFKTTIQPLIQKLQAKAPTELIKQTIQQIQTFMNQLRTVGAAYGFLDPNWLQSHTVCCYTIPAVWLEKAREAIMLHSFSVQSLLREENNAKRISSSMKHVTVSEEIARECNLSLLKQLSENLEKPVKFSVLFEFAQRFHLLLLRLELTS